MAMSEETTKLFGEIHRDVKNAIQTGAMDALLQNSDIEEIIALNNILFLTEYAVGLNDNNDIVILHKIK